MRNSIFVAAVLVLSTAAHADWKKDLKGTAQQQASAKLDQKLGIPSAAPAGAAVYFINLKDGASVTSPVLVQFGLRSAGISPPGTQIIGTGHHVLLVDNPQVDLTLALPTNVAGIRHFDKGETETTLTLTPGTHTLQLVFADWKQQSFNPTVQSEKITVTVK